MLKWLPWKWIKQTSTFTCRRNHFLKTTRVKVFYVLLFCKGCWNEGVNTAPGILVRTAYLNDNSSFLVTQSDPIKHIVTCIYACRLLSCNVLRKIIWFWLDSEMGSLQYMWKQIRSALQLALIVPPFLMLTAANLTR